MVGDGELRDQVEEMIHKFDLGSSFLITGWVDNPTAYMKIMDVGMLLSRWEGFGLVLPEYMACGVPIIATNVDAIPNIVKNGKNGMLVDKDDYLKIAQISVKIYNERMLQRNIISQERLQVNFYSGKRLTDQNIKMYKWVLNI